MKTGITMRHFKCLIIIFIFLFAGCRQEKKAVVDTNSVVITTWNVRGYPEKEEMNRQWFHKQLIKISPDIICIQEIANQADVDKFLATESHFNKAAFVDSPDGQDNAIFCDSRIEMKDLPDPVGFQHPAQAVYIACGGFDAVIVTVHLSWTNLEMREKEKVLLKNVVTEMLKIDPDVIILGDFNTEKEDIEELARSIGMVVMVPQGQEEVGTTHAGHQYDHFMISPDLADEEAISCHINTYTNDELSIAKKVSDHLSITAVFRTDSKFRDRK